MNKDAVAGVLYIISSQNVYISTINIQNFTSAAIYILNSENVQISSISIEG